MLTKFVLGLNWFVCDDRLSISNSIASTYTEEIHVFPLQSANAVLWDVGTVCGHCPSLAFDVTPLNYISQNLASAIAFWFLPGKADLTISGVNNLQILHWSRNI